MARQIVGAEVSRTLPARQRNSGCSVRIEPTRKGGYIPLATSDEEEAAARAATIYRTVVTEGWAVANERFPRELALALRWQDSPLAWTHTTFLHTSNQRSA